MLPPMPKKSTPDADLKAEFDGLRALAKEEQALKASLAKVQDRKRKTVHDLSTKKNANVASMAAIFGVSRQALTKEIQAHLRKAEAKKPAVSKRSAKKAPAKKAASKPAAKRVVRRTTKS